MLRKFIITVTIAAVFLFFSAASFWILFSKINQISLETDGMKSEIAQLESSRSQVQQTERYLKAHQNEVDLIRSFFLRQDERPLLFIENLEKLSKLTGNKLVLALGDKNSSKGDNQIIAGGEKKPQGKDIFFVVNIEGTEGSARKFLRFLEFMPYYLRVNRLVFQKGVNEAGGAVRSSAADQTGFLEAKNAPVNLQLSIMVKAI